MIAIAIDIKYAAIRNLLKLNDMRLRKFAQR